MKDDFDTIGAILKSNSFDSINSDFSLLIKNWEDIIGKVYFKKTEPVSISYQNGKTVIYVNVSSGSVIQDLGFYKKNILYKIKSKFNISADDIIFKVKDTIQFNEEKKVKQSITQKTYFQNPEAKELQNIELDEDDLLAIKKIEEQKFLDNKKKQKIVEFVIKDLKEQKWMKLHGYPICKNCGKVVRYKNFNEDVYCEACKYLLKNNELH